MIQTKSICFSYAEKEDVLKDISFIITEGERVGIIGPNGAGKTTLFHILCGILTPGGGTVSVNGKEVIPGSFNPDVGFVFQNPDDQLFNPTVYHDVSFGPLNLGLSKEESGKRAEKALKITGCTALRNRSPHHLSGGEKRMVSIASIISMEPRIIIYDEPSSNLDLRSRRRLINFINDSSETAVISSHDMEFILETCSRVFILDEGKLCADGRPDFIMYDEKLMGRHGLERPHSLLHKKKDHIHH